MDSGLIFRLTMSVLGAVASFFLGYFVLTRRGVNWIRGAFALYCFSGGFFILTRVLRTVITAEQYEIFGTFLVYFFGMGGVPIGIALFSRLLTHGTEETLNMKILPAIVVPPLVTALIGIVLNPSEVITISIGHVQVFEPAFQILYVVTTFGWMIYAAVNVALGVRRISEENMRKKMEDIRNGLFGIVITGFIAYGIATNAGWYDLMAVGDLVIVIFQVYIAYIYMKE